MDTLPTVWDAERHTLAKHGILKTYLEAWVAILSHWCPKKVVLSLCNSLFYNKIHRF